MDVTYNGPNPLNYRSAPSGTEYMFSPGESTRVQKEDEIFFKNMSKAPGSNFECVGLKEKVVKAAKKATQGDEE
jgi:hypothetical protein